MVKLVQQLRTKMLEKNSQTEPSSSLTWKDTLQGIDSYHPAIQPHAHRHLAARGMLDAGEVQLSEETLASYEGGWGFFNQTSMDPPEFQVTADDDLYVDVLLGEQKAEGYYSINETLDDEQKAKAQQGIAWLFEAAWGLPKGTFTDIDEARLRLYQLEDESNKDKKQELLRQGKQVHYQVDKRVKYHELFQREHFDGKFLHFGTYEKPANEEDLLDHPMRVYVHTQPEAVGHVAAETVRRMDDIYDKSIYGKLWDVSTAKGEHTVLRRDNLLFVIKTHSGMVAVADILKDLYAEAPGVFETERGKLERGRQTDLPMVFLAEEPNPAKFPRQESFNSSRSEYIETEAQDTLVKSFKKKYPNFDRINDIRDVFRCAYDNGIATKQDLKELLRKSVMRSAKKYGVSTKNYAMNSRR